MISKKKESTYQTSRSVLIKKFNNITERLRCIKNNWNSLSSPRIIRNLLRIFFVSLHPDSYLMIWRSICTDHDQCRSQAIGLTIK